MSRAKTGTVRLRNGRWYARVSVGETRPTFALDVADENGARARATLLATLADKLCATGHAEIAPAILGRAATAEGRALETECEVVERLCAGKLVRTAAATGPASTFAAVAKLWTSGDLARRYPDHVRPKRDVTNDVSRLGNHVLPIVGEVPIASFSLDHAERVMLALPAGYSSQTRRHVANLMHRVLAMAVFPLRLRADNPLPSGWLPRVTDTKAKSYLYPGEDAQLLGCSAVPLMHRMVYGVLGREGMRLGEVEGLRWRDVDLERGSVTLDENKTNDPRAWALGPDVAAALRAWRTIVGEPDGDELVFAGPSGAAFEGRADRLRRELRLAGVEREQLYTRSASRQPLRVHDLRGTFVTLALAAGRSETWVADRTGHRSSDMINTYRRAARSAAELGLGWLAPLDRAIPELIGAAIGAATSSVASSPGDALAERATAAGDYERRATCDSNARPSASEGERGGSTGGNASNLQGDDAAEQPRSARPAPAEPAQAPADAVEQALADAVEQALADALSRAAAAGRFDVVAQLAKELEARRLGNASNVVDLETARRKRGSA